MRPILLFLLFFFSVSCFSQTFTLDKGADTIMISGNDTLCKIPFQTTSFQVGYNPRLLITHHSGSARPNLDYALRDAYNKNVDTINVTNVENNKGAFFVFVRKSVDDNKDINLEVILFDKKATKKTIARILLRNTAKPTTPAAAAPVKPGQPVKSQKDTLSFTQFKDIKVSVYKNSDGEDKECRKVNIARIVIQKKEGSNSYYIEVITVDNQSFYIDGLACDSKGHISNDKVFLNGNDAGGDEYLHLYEFISTRLETNNKQVKELTPSDAGAKLPIGDK